VERFVNWIFCRSVGLRYQGLRLKLATGGWLILDVLVVSLKLVVVWFTGLGRELRI
jgi:hypothetical protein